MKKFKFFSILIVSALFLATCAFSTNAQEVTNEKSVDTELVFIVDKSGSMHGLTEDTIGSFNSVIEEQKSSEKEGNVYVTTVMFNQNHSKIHDRENIKDVSNITKKEYTPSGCTALLDAVGNTITELSAKEEIKNNKVIFVIITDGFENASKEFKKDQVKKLIEDKQNSDKWEFIFLGANIDSVSTAGEIGISPKYARNFCASSRGIKDTYKRIGSAINQVRDNKEIDLDKSDETKDLNEKPAVA